VVTLGNSLIWVKSVLAPFKKSSIAFASSNIRYNIFTLGKFGKEVFQLDCNFSQFFGEFQKCRSQLWSTGLYGQFGTARGMLTAFWGRVPCEGSQQQLGGSASRLSATGA
jgi:hypothetical protein